ncbi:MAG: hypothetical protein ACYSSP_09070 [Planctomycetota bacterium]|jgi:sulfite reductase (ferredoxin)
MMSRGLEPILRLPDSVKQDILNYRSQVEKYLNGQTSPIAFKAYRVPMGIYEQRVAGKYMIRIRIGAGLVLPFQLQRIAELSQKHGNGILHVTTRQDIQIHEVNIEHIPDVLEGLLEVGLSASRRRNLMWLLMRLQLLSTFCNLKVHTTFRESTK